VIFTILSVLIGCSDAPESTTSTIDTGTPTVTSTSYASRSCTTTLRYEPTEAVSSVALAGAFNDWSESANPMLLQPDGSYTVSVFGFVTQLRPTPTVRMATKNLGIWTGPFNATVGRMLTVIVFLLFQTAHRQWLPSHQWTSTVRKETCSSHSRLCGGLPVLK
jgi:hypothetical protein